MDSLPCTLIIPAAGDSVRFRDKTSVPKGLVRFGWKGRVATMIEHIVPRRWNGKVVVACKIADMQEFRRRLPNSMSVLGITPTSGQSETVINVAAYSAGTDILVVNSDNAFEEGVLEDFVDTCRANEAMCGAVTFRPAPNADPYRYGYVDDHPYFKVGAEKVPISRYAVAGAFYFQSWKVISRFVGGSQHYISEWFIDIPKPKLSYEIHPSKLFEWGTWETLEESVGSVMWELA